VYLLGIDVGTTGCKAAVFSYKGELVAFAYREYPLIIPKTGWMELDPQLVVDEVFSCISECTKTCCAEQIIALSISSQGEAVVPVGKNGDVLSTSILTFDSRCSCETEQLLEIFGRDYIYEVTGAPLSSMFTLPKILWIKKNQGEVFSKTWKFMCFGDFIAYRLGADPCIDFSMASRTLLFDIKKRSWSHNIFSETGLKEELFSEPIASAQLIGTVSPKTSKELGLPLGTKIISGGHDQVCCALGCGVINYGIAMDSLGTTESILTVKKECMITESMKKSNFPCYVFPVNGLYAYFSFLASSGSILRWFRDKFTFSCPSYSYEELNTKAENRYPNPTGIFVLPYFSGSGTPYLDTQSKGIIAGLSLNTDVFVIYKAILEGTCFEGRLNIDLMEKAGIVINQIRCIGGGAKSDLWMQIKANITGKEISIPDITEAGCAGAAILAGIGAGVFPNIEEAIGNFVKIKKTFNPQPELEVAYKNMFVNYQTLYKNNSGLFK
jgi:xylulokinase